MFNAKISLCEERVFGNDNGRIWHDPTKELIADFEKEIGKLPALNSTGGVSIVEEYLKENMGDPQSLELVRWSGVAPMLYASAPGRDMEKYWAVRCKYRAKNRSGVLDVYESAIFIRHSSVDRVVDTLGYNLGNVILSGHFPMGFFPNEGDIKIDSAARDLQTTMNDVEAFLQPGFKPLIDAPLQKREPNAQESDKEPNFEMSKKEGEGSDLWIDQNKASPQNVVLPRDFVDSTGKHKITATFIGYVNGRVVLQRDDKSEFVLQLKQLCDSDQTWILEQANVTENKTNNIDTVVNTPNSKNASVPENPLQTKALSRSLENKLTELLVIIKKAADSCDNQVTSLAHTEAIEKAHLLISNSITPENINIQCKVMDAGGRKDAYYASLVAHNLFKKPKSAVNKEIPPEILTFASKITTLELNQKFNIPVDHEMAQSLVPGDIVLLTGSLIVQAAGYGKPSWEPIIRYSSNNQKLMFFVELKGGPSSQVIKAHLLSPKITVVSKASKAARK